MDTTIAPGWSGEVTKENHEELAAVIQQILNDKYFSYHDYLKKPAEQEWGLSADYSEQTYTTKDIYTQKGWIWIQDNFGTLHIHPGDILTFDEDGQGFTIEEQWRPERAIHKYQYHVNKNQE